MLESLAADLRKSQKDLDGALKILRLALVKYPQERGITYALIEISLLAGQPQEALRLCQEDLQMYPSDVHVHGLQAKTYAALGLRLQQHRAQAEVYVLQGLLLESINQLQLAQKASDGDFYEHSQVDARLRELKIRQAAEAKNKKQDKSDKQDKP